MSFNLRNVREISNEPLSKFVSHLAYRIAKLQNDQATQDLENKADIYSAGEDVDSVIKFHELNRTKTFDLETSYYPPTEPDLDKNTLWLQGYNMGNNLRDISGFNNDVDINGDPILIDGAPFDYGIHTGGAKSIALRFNRVDGSGVDHSDHDDDNDFPEYLNADDEERIRLEGATSMSWFFRVRPLSTDKHKDKRRTIYCKTDTLGANDEGEVVHAVRFSIDDNNKRLIIQLKDTTYYAKRTNSNTFVEDNIYDVFVTYNAGTIKCYMAKMTSAGVADSSPTDMTLNDSGFGEEWGEDLANTDARFMKRGTGVNDGAFHGDLFDFKIYRNYTVSSAEAGYHWNNKWTIANIPYGQVMVANYYNLPAEFTAGYDSTGYDSTGYDTV